MDLLAPGRSRLTVSLAAACYSSHTLEHGMTMILLFSFFFFLVGVESSRHTAEPGITLNAFWKTTFFFFWSRYLVILYDSICTLCLFQLFYRLGCTSALFSKISPNVSTIFGHILSVFNKASPFFLPPSLFLLSVLSRCPSTELEEKI